MPPAKKSLSKKRQPPSSRDYLPTKNGKHKHQGMCWEVRLHKNGKPVEGMNTYHCLDEAGAVMFGMRSSRYQACNADVYGPDGKLICSFGPRTYDVRLAQSNLLDLNESYSYSRDVWDQIAKARRDRDPSLYPRAAKPKVKAVKKPVKKTLSKKVR